MLLNWLDFFLALLWIILIGFLLSYSNLINIFLLTELIWIFIFLYSSFLSSKINTIFIFLISVYILTIATVETTVGFSLLIVKMSIFGSINNNNTVDFRHYFLTKRKFSTIINSKILK